MKTSKYISTSSVIKAVLIKIVFYAIIIPIHAQEFVRSEIAVDLTIPWEIIYGQDNFLWLSESGGTVSRVDPNTGAKTTVYTAPDYSSGSASENNDICGNSIGANTYGLALHPDFLNSANSYLFLYYSYNASQTAGDSTLFKIVRLKWDATSESITETKDLYMKIPNGYDHWGGRMIAINQNGKDYLYFSVGDEGLVDDSCYDSPEDNPNDRAQEVNFKNGKIHRIYTDGSILENRLH